MYSFGTPVSAYYTILHCDTDLQATSPEPLIHNKEAKPVEVTEYMFCCFGDTKLHLELYLFFVSFFKFISYCIVCLSFKV